MDHTDLKLSISNITKCLNFYTVNQFRDLKFYRFFSFVSLIRNYVQDNKKCKGHADVLQMWPEEEILRQCFCQSAFQLMVFRGLTDILTELEYWFLSVKVQVNGKEGCYLDFRKCFLFAQINDEIKVGYNQPFLSYLF